jgi:hypothetical protein
MTSSKGKTDMSYTATANRIIELADGLGYGIDIDFTGRKPIAIKPLRGPSKKFTKMEDVLQYLEARKAQITNL